MFPMARGSTARRFRGCCGRSPAAPMTANTATRRSCTISAARSRARPCEATHLMFHEAMLVSGVSPRKAAIMYAAVRYAGPRWSEMDIYNANLATGGRYGGGMADFGAPDDGGGYGGDHGGGYSGGDYGGGGVGGYRPMSDFPDIDASHEIYADQPAIRPGDGPGRGEQERILCPCERDLGRSARSAFDRGQARRPRHRPNGRSAIGGVQIRRQPRSIRRRPASIVTGKSCPETPLWLRLADAGPGKARLCWEPRQGVQTLSSDWTPAFAGEQPAQSRPR